MAVVNAIVTGNAESVAVDTGLAARFSGGLVKAIPFSFEVAAADDDGSIYRFARISPQAIVVGLFLQNDVVTGGSDYDLGLYKPTEVGGAVIDKDCFVDGATMVTDRTAGAWIAPTVANGANMGKAAATLAGKTDAEAAKLPGVDVAFTANTVGTAAGTIAGVLFVIDGV